MDYKTCENCCFIDNTTCLYYSKKVKVIIDNKEMIKATTLQISKDWWCKNFKPAMCIEDVCELNREIEKEL